MSLTLLLSQYPKSILKDKTALVILTLLERGGFTNEQEIAGQLGADKTALAGHLLSLHRNQLIEYGRNYIRLSERGKTFLDAFELSEDVVEDVLAGFQMSATERASLKGIILGYRERAYPRYLRSVESMRSWESTCSHFHWQKGQRQFSAKVGSLALWLRDLRNWLAHDVETASNYKDVWQPLNAALLSNVAVTHADTGHAIHAAKWIRELDSLERNFEQPLLLQKLEPKVALFCVFTHARSNLEVEPWLDEWRPLGRSVLILDACRSGPQAVEKLTGLHWQKWPLTLHQPLETSTLRQVPTDAPAEPTSDMLEKILAAGSLEDLAAQTAFTRTGLIVLLSLLREKCGVLLRTPDAPSPSMDPSSQSQSEARTSQR